MILPYSRDLSSHKELKCGPIIQPNHQQQQQQIKTTYQEESMWI
jgi:hypothetical protein